MNSKRTVCGIIALALVLMCAGTAVPAYAEDVTNLRWEGNVAAWDQVDGASGYEVLLFWNTWQEVCSVSVTDCRFDFSDYLHPGYSYCFNVRWVRDGEKGAFAISPDFDVPGEPETFKISVDAETNLVTWEEPEGAEYFDIWVCLADDSAYRMITDVKAGQGSCNVTEIVNELGSNSYVILMSAYKMGYGNEFAASESEPVSLSVIEGYVPTAAPEGSGSNSGDGSGASQGDSAGEPAGSTGSRSGGMLWLGILIGVLVTAAAVAGVVLVLKKKKR